jgi:hypothetical protein
MALWIQQHGNPAATDPGAIHTHAGQYFSPDPPAQPLYRVATEPGGKEVVHQEQVRVLGRLVRTYLLVRLN